MNKRLEDIKNSDYSILKVDSDLKRDWEWLIEQAEREVSHSNKINKLHFFLDNNVADLASERCGYHVIDVAIHVMKKQAELIRDLEKDVKELEIVNKRYQKALELIKLKTLDIKGDKDTRPFQIYGIASEALEESE